jgi:hypothetical protein
MDAIDAKDRRIHLLASGARSQVGARDACPCRDENGAYSSDGPEGRSRAGLVRETARTGAKAAEGDVHETATMR